MEFTLLANAIVAVGAMWAALRWLAPPEAIENEYGDRLYAAIGVGILAGRLAAMLSSGTNPISHPGDILIIRGGVSTGVAATAALATWAWTSRHELRRASDIAAPAVLIGLAGWHGGCVFRDACAGTTADLPWAITLSGSTVGRHPVELYAAILFVAAAVVIRRLPVGSGVPAGVAIGAAALIRLATEPMRASITGGPTEWYIIGIAAGIAVALIARRAADTAGLHSPP